MIGYDKSRYQTPGAGPWGGFEIIQAGRGRDPGTGLFDPNCSAHVAEARNRNVPVSLYWRVFPELSAEQQADMLVSVARRENISPATTLWLDIENPSSSEPWPGDPVAYEAAFVTRVNGSGWPCGTYANENFWKTRFIRGAQGRWVANFSQPPVIPFDIWQRTSSPLDTNEADAAAVARLFATAPQAPASFYEEQILHEQSAEILAGVPAPPQSPPEPPAPLPEPTPPPEPPPAPTSIGVPDQMAVSIFNQGLFHSFVVGDDGRLRERYGNPVPDGPSPVIAEGLKPNSPVSVGRIVYDPNNPFYPAYFLTALADDGVTPVTIVWTSDHWEVHR